MDFIKSYIPNIHKEGVFFIVIALFAAAILLFVSSSLAALVILLAIFMVFFFRDPVRITPIGESFIVSSADGVITKIEEAILPEALGFNGKKKTTKVSIFLSVFDVHVNRIPADGIIKAINYHKGLFLSATNDKSSDDNERNEILMTLKNGDELVFTQIAGLIARRIVNDAKVGQEVKAGERYGIIRFGSRMDIYLPQGVKPMVFVGQRVIGGETIIADVTQKQGLQGEVR